MRTLNPELSLQIIQPVANFCAISDVEFPLLSFLFDRSVIELSHPSLAFCQTFFKIFQVDEHLYDKFILGVWNILSHHPVWILVSLTTMLWSSDVYTVITRMKRTKKKKSFICFWNVLLALLVGHLRTWGDTRWTCHLQQSSNPSDSLAIVTYQT